MVWCLKRIMMQPFQLIIHKIFTFEIGQKKNTAAIPCGHICCVDRERASLTWLWCDVYAGNRRQMPSRTHGQVEMSSPSRRRFFNSTPKMVESSVICGHTGMTTELTLFFPLVKCLPIQSRTSGMCFTNKGLFRPNAVLAARTAG